MAIVDTQGEALEQLLQGVIPENLREIRPESVLILPNYGRVTISGIRHDGAKKVSTICLMDRTPFKQICDEQINQGYLVFLRKANEEEIMAFCGPEGPRSRILSTFILLRVVHSASNIIQLQETDRKKTYVELV